MLNKLVLKNWKSHKNNEITFSQGYNVFVGNIGSGKTSIFDAIVFALFGSTPNITARKIAVKDLIMSKPLEEEQAEITLEFTIDNENYRIERILHRTKSSQAKIYKNDSLIRGPKPSDVNDEVEKILGINIDAFMKANYAEQNSIDYFLRLPANERKNLFDSMFDISFYDDISINSRQINNKLKTKYDELINKTNEYKKLLENYNRTEIEEKIKKIKEEITKIKEELQTIEKNISEQKNKEQEINKQKQDYEQLNNTINNLQGKQSYLEKELSQLLQLTINKEELQLTLTKLKAEKDLKNSEKNKIDQEYNNLRSKTLFYNNKLNDLQTKQNEFNRIDNLLKEIPQNINDLVNKLVSDIENSKELITKTETTINALEKDIKILEKTEANCPLCTQELTHEHKDEILTNKILTKEQLEQKLSKENENYLNHKKDYDLKNKQRDFYNRNIEMFEKVKLELKDIENIKKQIIDNYELEKRHKEQLNTIQTELTNLDNKIKDSESKLKILTDIDNKQNDLKRIKEDLQINKTELQKITYNPEEYTKIKTELQKYNSEQQYKKEIIIEKEKQSKEEQFKLDQYNSLLSNQTKSEKESSILKTYIEDFNVLGQVSKKTQEQVRSYVVESINLVFQDLWQNIYPYKDFQNIRFNISEGDYKIELLFNNEYKRELDEYISGGERSSIALALRIAMCLVMKNKLNLIILDEPTHNLDKKTVLALSELFNSYLPQFIEQTFVITHDTDLEQYAKNVYFIERDKSEDSPSEIRIK